MDKDAALKFVAELIEREGRLEAQAVLVRAGLGLSTVQKLLKGDYSKPGKRVLSRLESLAGTLRAS